MITPAGSTVAGSREIHANDWTCLAEPSCNGNRRRFHPLRTSQLTRCPDAPPAMCPPAKCCCLELEKGLKVFGVVQIALLAFFTGMSAVAPLPHLPALCSTATEMCVVRAQCDKRRCPDVVAVTIWPIQVECACSPVTDPASTEYTAAEVTDCSWFL